MQAALKALSGKEDTTIADIQQLKGVFFQKFQEVSDVL
jgi:hypothetical protein